MCAIDDAICDCSCHRDNTVKHMMPCCVLCLYCDRNIKEFYINSHQEECKLENKRTKCIFCRAIIDSAMLEGHIEQCRKVVSE